MAIPEYYAEKNVFITGGAGFIGKVLIEKLLRSCPKIGRIYLMLRPKKGMNIEDRLQKIVSAPIFDNVKEHQPSAIPEKLIPIAGEMSYIGLGLSKEDRQTLIKEVNIIFHCAASVRFDDPLQDAILLNTRGTREICQLALEMKNISVFEHISTTYCNCDQKVVEEKLYPPHADWRKMIEIAETVDKYTLQILSAKVTDKLPNTYTFTKSLSEHVVNDLLKGRIPTVILRPSIVSSAIKEPLEGWVDNFNGPFGLTTAVAKGVIRYPFLEEKTEPDVIPVDICVRRMITVAWSHGTKRDTDIAVYNCSSLGSEPYPLSKIISLGKREIWKYPLNNVLWFPAFGYTSSLTTYHLNVIFLHMLPALFIDAGLRIMGQKPMMLTLQRKIYTATIAIMYFMTNQWRLLNDKMIAAETVNMPENCVKEFGSDICNIDVEEYIITCGLGCRKFLLKDLSDFEVARKNLYKMYVLDIVVKLLLCAGICWLLCIKLNLISSVVGCSTNYLKNLRARWCTLIL